MLRAVEIVRALCPRAHPNYVQAFEHGDDKLVARGITTPLRLAHFLAQVFHETGGLEILRESGSYTAARIMEIFGVGRHSAAITAAEAKRLAKNGPALFERAYGLGNPKMAASLGNTQPGDGWDKRGNGLNQGTGRGFHERASKATGVDFVGHPELATSPEYALVFALVEWDDTFLSLSDRNDIRAVTKRLNGGYNGLQDRIDWFDKIWKMIQKGGPVLASWQASGPDAGIRLVQSQLAQLGYTLDVDGRQGPATTAAIRDFQAKAGLQADGFAGPLTRTAIEARLSGSTKPPKPDTADPPAVPNAAGIGGKVVGGGAAGLVAIDQGQKLLDQAQTLQGVVPHVPVLKYAVAGVTTLGVALLVYAILRPILKPKPGAPS